MKMSWSAVSKGILYTALALAILGFVKTSMPDVWAKIPGLNKF